MLKRYTHLEENGLTAELSLRRLMDIIEILRRECPWDRVQTHRTLMTPMIEEAYEVVDAISKDDMVNLREELGDVLLQIVFHASIEEENGNFQLKDVINDECNKMIRRHPHVFFEETENNGQKSIDKVLEKWENIKAEEKGTSGQASIMEDIPKSFPALTLASKVQSKAAKVGFDWDDVSFAIDKVYEELEELKENMAETPPNMDALSEEMGDLLFSCVNVSRFLGIDPELALRYTVDKFKRRFSYIEMCAVERGMSVETMSLSEMDGLWDEAKQTEHINKI